MIFLNQNNNSKDVYKRQIVYSKGTAEGRMSKRPKWSKNKPQGGQSQSILLLIKSQVDKKGIYDWLLKSPIIK